MQQDIDKIKAQIKENINALIGNGYLEEAKNLINEYNKMIPEDIEIYSMNAIVAIMEQDLNKAEKIIKEGIILDSYNFDLFYNLGYLYEIQNRIMEAIASYNIAKIICRDDNFKVTLEEKISILSRKKINNYDVILCGKLEQCTAFEVSLKEWNIVGYIISENNKDYNKKILSIDKIKKHKYDFIIVLDEVCESEILNALHKYGINRNIYLYSDFKTSVIEGFDYRIRELLYKNDINTIITGLSYAEVGIKAEKLNKNAINFALSSQDIFYDYHILNYILNYENVKNSIKYVILGLSYYSFDYDMSKSIAKYRVHRYINYIEKLHNNNDKIGVDITKALYEKRVGMKEYFYMNEAKENTIMKYEDIEQEYVANKNSSMDYELTRKENMDIFVKCLSLLETNNIKPIVVIVPTSKHYFKYFKDGYQKDKFYKVMNDFKRNYDFQIIDYCNSSLFSDDDFWDYGHLNGKGAEKFTQILNKEIIW